MWNFRGLIFSKYLVASLVALAVDLALFVQMIAFHVPAALASALAYSAGIVVHWAISSRLVFKGRVAIARRQRTVQKAQFVLSALVGLAITTAVVGAGSYFGLDPRVAKLVAIALSFLTVWYARNRYIFQMTSDDRLRS
jgi:putative flippase GtrA